jgi:hypothetical protein
MFNDKLVILTYKNTIYQSKLKLWAMFVTILVCKQHTLFQTDFARTQFTIQRRSYLDWLELEYPRHKLLANTFPHNISWKPLFGVFACFRWIFTHICSSLGEKYRFKNSDKIVDTVTLNILLIKFKIRIQRVVSQLYVKVGILLACEKHFHYRIILLIEEITSLAHRQCRIYHCA